MTDIEQIQVIFKRFDTDGDGQIDLDEFCAMARQIGVGRELDIMRHSFNKLDDNDDGRIDFEEFKRWWQGLDS